jgi:type VI secretion system protein
MQLLLTVSGSTLFGGRLAGSDRMRRVSPGERLSIGRGPDNDWVLPDPARIVGRLHCTISGEDGRFVLTDLSSNGIYMNGSQHSTARERRILLTDGDQFRLGDYVIGVAEVADAAAAGVDETRLGRRDTLDPFAGDPLADSDDSLLDRRADSGFQHPIPHVPGRRADADPFDDAGLPPASLDEDLYRGLTPSGDWLGAPVPDHAPVPRHAVTPPRVIPVTPPGEIDFDALLGDLIPRGGGETPAPPAAPPEPAASVRLSEAAMTSIRPETARPAGSSLDARAALAAFLVGAGVPAQSVDDSDPEAALRAAGAIFRTMADGVREILISRATIKGEMRVNQTMIRPRGNNALKFSATPEEAVIALLRPKRPGYMEPLAAAQEAFSDIKSHELAVIAGMRNALLALLRRFNPTALEERLTKGRLDAVLPAARKARFWDAFCLTYGEISREAEDDFQAAFGRSFATAYKALTAKEHKPDD